MNEFRFHFDDYEGSMRRYLAATAMSLGMIGNAAWANSPNQAAMRELATAMQEYLIATYSCQKFIGGMGQYRSAKTLVTETYTRLSGDRNQAVLAVDGLEKEIKAAKMDERMEAGFKNIPLSEADSVETCQNAVAESQDKFEVTRAKLGLL